MSSSPQKPSHCHTASSFFPRENLEVNQELLATEEVEGHKKPVVSLNSEGDNENALSQHKEAVKRLLNLT